MACFAFLSDRPALLGALSLDPREFSIFETTISPKQRENRPHKRKEQRKKHDKKRDDSLRIVQAGISNNFLASCTKKKVLKVPMYRDCKARKVQGKQDSKKNIFKHSKNLHA